jgi:hypothetical protein
VIDQTTKTGPIEAWMAFTKPSDVQVDSERSGMLRAVTRPNDADPREVAELKSCRLWDVSAAVANHLSLEEMGFDRIDLSRIDRLQSTLEAVRAASHVTRAQASIIRKELTGRSFEISNGKRLRLLFIAPEGFIMRKAGPNGLKIDPSIEMSEMNDHDGALSVHADQDVHGTPLRQMMRGAAPWIFRHQSPDGVNKRSPVFLVNVWIPLQQISRPLALMDRRTLDNRRHQLCYALPTDGFLERDESRRVNDIWTFLHDDAQEWHFNSEMDSSSAYVFDTLGTPHGSVVLPGEDVAAYYYTQLKLGCEAFRARDGSITALGAESAAPTIAEDTTAALRHAIEAMASLRREGQDGARQPGFFESDWCERAERAMDRVVRKSIEMRAVAVLMPDAWPFNRLTT